MKGGFRVTTTDSDEKKRSFVIIPIRAGRSGLSAFEMITDVFPFDPEPQVGIESDRRLVVEVDDEIDALGAMSRKRLADKMGEDVSSIPASAAVGADADHLRGRRFRSVQTKDAQRDESGFIRCDEDAVTAFEVIEDVPRRQIDFRKYRIIKTDEFIRVRWQERGSAMGLDRPEGIAYDDELVFVHAAFRADRGEIGGASCVFLGKVECTSHTGIERGVKPEK